MVAREAKEPCPVHRRRGGRAVTLERTLEVSHRRVGRPERLVREPAQVVEHTDRRMLGDERRCDRESLGGRPAEQELGVQREHAYVGGRERERLAGLSARFAFVPLGEREACGEHGDPGVGAEQGARALELATNAYEPPLLHLLERRRVREQPRSARVGHKLERRLEPRACPCGLDAFEDGGALEARVEQSLGLGHEEGSLLSITGTRRERARARERNDREEDEERSPHGHGVAVERGPGQFSSALDGLRYAGVCRWGRLPGWLRSRYRVPIRCGAG